MVENPVIKWARALKETNTDGKFTPGKIYDVIRVYGRYYDIDNMDNHSVSKDGWDKDRFEDVAEEAPEVSAKASQVGGSHYTKLAIQPFEYINANNIGFNEGTAIAYLTRWKDKGGIEDLKKAIHSIQWLIEWEECANV